jgi:hypothetical protein
MYLTQYNREKGGKKIAYKRLDNSYSLPDTIRMMKLKGE